MKYQRVLMLEDDPLQGTTIFRFLMERLATHVDRLVTESDFHRYLNEIKRGRQAMPDLVISDMMMPWAWPGENKDIPVPEVVRKETFRRAGFRCLGLMQDLCRQSVRRASIPWVFFSVLSREDVETPVAAEGDVLPMFITKEEGLERLFETIASLESTEWTETDKQVSDGLMGNEATRNNLLTALAEKWQDSVIWKLKPA
jgi:hypothetical protein